MTKHRYLLIEISKEFEPIVKNTKAIPSDHEAYCIIDLATATISNDGKDWTPFEIEGENSTESLLRTCKDFSDMVLNENHKKNSDKQSKTRVFGTIDDHEFWSDKPIQPGHPKYKPAKKLPDFKGIEQTEKAISALLDFKPCSSIDSESCDYWLSTNTSCKGCPHNEAEKSK